MVDHWDLSGDKSTVYLDGFDEYWIRAVNDSRHNWEPALKILLRLAQLFASAAADLQLLPQQNNPDCVTAWKLVKYYYFGILAAQTRAHTIMFPAPGAKIPAIATPQAKKFDNDIATELTILKGFLQTAYNIVDPTPIPPVEDAPVGANHPGWIQIPNRQLVELIIHAKWNSMNVKPETLQDFKFMISQLNITTFCQVSGSELAFPHVIHACLGHKDNNNNRVLIATCSSDKWKEDGFLGRIKTDSDKWRDARIDPNVKTAMEPRGTAIRSRFIALRNWIKANRPVAGTALDNKQGAQDNYNWFVAAMFDISLPGAAAVGQAVIPLGTGANHEAEAGRPFNGRGVFMGTEMSRCWKCRFLYYYARANPNAPLPVNAIAWAEELPTQTSFAANEYLSCAEDLCHSLCSQQLLPNTAANPLAAEPVTPYPNVVPVEPAA